MCFCSSITCQRFVAYYTNGYYHSRAWQVVAKAIEEQSLRLLGVEVDLMRIESMYADRKARGEVSVHNLEVCGFIDPIGEPQ
jgi:hypothetical protein